jgi:predicted amidohydrolase YtcJ
VKGDRGPDKRVLDAVVSERPVWFVSEWWHSSWLNSRALEELGVDEHTPDPKTGVAAYARDDSGEPTGWVLEGAGWQHFAEQFPIEDADHRQSHQQDVLAGLQILSESGVTAVYDGGNFGFEDLVYGFMAGLEKEEKLPVRVEGTYQVFTPDRMGSAVSEMKRYRREYGGDRLQFNAVKLFMDGIYPNRTSALLEPHTDNPSYVGDTVLSVEELRDFLLELNAAQLDAHIHAMGDLAVKRTLDAVEQARGAAGEDFYPRVTITHVGLVDPADLPRIEELGVICNFTPWWFTTDPDDSLRVALGGNRYDSMYKPNSLLDLGIDVTFSSDEWWGGELLPTYLNPYFAMQVGHTRQYPSEWRDVDEIARPPANERLSIEQLLVGYTLTGAYQLRMDDEIGSIEEGKLADLVVLDDDLFEIEPDEIWKTKPAAVLMEGEVIRGALPAGTRQ